MPNQPVKQIHFLVSIHNTWYHANRHGIIMTAAMQIPAKEKAKKPILC